jgi:NPCBM/NEW2 domain
MFKGCGRETASRPQPFLHRPNYEQLAMTHLRGLLVVSLVLIAGPSWADEIKTISGKSINGTLEKITDANITLKSDGTTSDTPLSQVLDLTLRPNKTLPTAPKYFEVQLIDESILRCTKVDFGAKEFQVELTSGVSMKIPLAAVVTVLRDAHDAALRAEFAKLVKGKKNVDRIFFFKDGNLQVLQGAIGDIDDATAQTIKFNYEGKKDFTFQLKDVYGLRYVRTDPPAAASVCRVIDIDGNLIVASKLGYGGGKVNITTPFGSKLEVDYKLVARFDFNFGRLTYLSDLDAKISDAILLGGFNPVRKDTNLDGLPIILQDKKYDKGLSMYAGVEVEYNLGQKYKDFKALLGVDSRIADEGQGKVTVTVYCDGEKRSTLEVSAKAPVPITISVKDISTLRIVVSGSNFTNYSGHATLANAAVSQ